MEDRPKAANPSATLHPPTSDFSDRLHAALHCAMRELLAARNPEGHWVGELSSSALSTATAVTALAVQFSVQARRPSPGVAPDNGRRTTDLSAIRDGLNWLAQNVNADGGWGDTTQSLSNLSTTALCWAAFGAVPGADEQYHSVVERAKGWLAKQAGGIEPEKLAPALIHRYGKDRTFSAPILTTLALAGRLGPGREAWRWVLQSPFELAACPHQWFAALRLPVVSYALPALIAVGQARHFHRPTRNPVARLARSLTRQRTLRILSEIQPDSGGFLEATPLTSFVVMSLASSGQARHAVTKKGGDFLLRSQRADGSWPIDTNLATWVTTLAVNALANCESSISARLETGNWAWKIQEWLLAQQHRAEHPYTHAPPGGWAWTDLSGGVPDADDTAGALLALRKLGEPDDAVRAAARSAVGWLVGLQNRDGGVPTFCRGWGALPFDRSSPDLTAHVIRAWLAWREESKDNAEVPQTSIGQGIRRAVGFLARSQRDDGAWIPLWFGNQLAPQEENPTYGTARVVCALAELAARSFGGVEDLLVNGARWLLDAQQADGGWGGAAGVPASVEETALAVEALAGVVPLLSRIDTEGNLASLPSAVARGTQWLIERVESGEWQRALPIGFYFARLWYYERLYPQIFTVGALGKVAKLLKTLGRGSCSPQSLSGVLPAS